MTEKRFTYTARIITDKKGYCKYYIWDNETLLNTEQIVGILNAQNEYIDYVTKERNLACNKLDKQQATIQSLKEENEQLKQQLLYEGDDVCGICKHEYLTPSHNYFISKCEKGHEECSKEDIKYCEDFKLKELEDE